jgi:hypothetical protein
VAPPVPRRIRVASRLPEKPVSARLEAKTVRIAACAEAASTSANPGEVRVGEEAPASASIPGLEDRLRLHAAPGWLVHRSQPCRAETKEREVPVAPTHGPPTRCQVRPRSVVRITGPISTSPGRERTANPTSCAPKEGSTRCCALRCHVRPPSWLCSSRVGHGEANLVPHVSPGSTAAQASRVPRTTVIDRTAAPRQCVVQLRPPSLVTAIAPLQKYVRPEHLPQSVSAAAPSRAFQKEIEVGIGVCRAAPGAAPPDAVTSSRQTPTRVCTGQSMRMNPFRDRTSRQPIRE